MHDYFTNISIDVPTARFRTTINYDKLRNVVMHNGGPIGRQRRVYSLPALYALTRFPAFDLSTARPHGLVFMVYASLS